jgi:hypothetical protein
LDLLSFELQILFTFTFLFFVCLFELTIHFEWLISQVGCHSTTDTKSEVLFDFNAKCAQAVKKLCAAFAQRKTTGVKTMKEDISKEMVD